MPYRAPTGCSQPGCGRLAVKAGRCAEDQLLPRPSPSKRGYGAKWQKIRKEHLAMEPYCRECGRSGIRVEATDVDHMIRRSMGGSDGHENLQSLCHSHHSQKTGRGG